MSAAKKELIGDHFLDLWSKTRARKPESDEEEELPTELDPDSIAGGFAVVGPDRLSVRYPNVSLHDHDAGVVKANHAAPMKRMIYYFEIFVQNEGAKGRITVGFTTSAFNAHRQPGWEESTFGYNADDGLFYNGQTSREEFGPTFAAGDTVGAGINYETQNFFFTLNGALAALFDKDIKGPVFPSVSLHSHYEEVLVNFGQRGFSFDLKAYEAEERFKIEEKFRGPVSVPQNADHGIVRSYLQHYGYGETLKHLDIDLQSIMPSISAAPEDGASEEDTMYAFNQRRTLRQLINSGNIDETFSTLGMWYPQIIEGDSSVICFMLHCQKFIELVQDEKIADALWYGKSELAKFMNSSAFGDIAKDCCALLVYGQPSESSVGYLLGDAQRELVADAVNATILSTNPNMKDASLCKYSAIERLIQQLQPALWRRGP
ncbi:ran-binding protein M [Salvia divinorum]|uniref:Ran-binding protein M n=1 Tax=Salvia divinorum TaxID=28513 RepID=A0ABD1FPQ5_SALDI